MYGVGYGSRGRITTKEQANTLAIIDMSIMDVEKCKQHASAANATNTSENKKSIGVSPLASSANSYCTIGNEPFSSMCHGDSGSPLIQINDGKPSVLEFLLAVLPWYVLMKRAISMLQTYIQVLNHTITLSTAL